MDSSNTLTIITSTRKSEAEVEEWKKNIKSTCTTDVNFIVIQNQGDKGLAEVYNEAMAKSETDILCFVHDDIDFVMNGWDKKMIDIFDSNQEYGILGVVGAKQYSNGGWWHSQQKYHVGQILHSKNGLTWFSEYSPYVDFPILEEVCTIDGLFIGVNKQKIKLPFDDDFKGFHFYDVSFCIRNFLEGCKIGVSNDIRVLHFGLGNWNTDAWHQANLLMQGKYGENLPVSTKEKYNGKNE